MKINDTIARLRKKYFIWVVFFIALGGFLRFFNLGWDQGNNFHPDEQLISYTLTGSINPPGCASYFPYGGFAIFLYRLCTGILAFLTGDYSLLKDVYAINIIGRVISASVSTFCIYLMYKIAGEIVSARYALLCALLTAFNVGLIQNAHYATPETLLVLFLMIMFLYSIKILKSKGFFLGNWILLSVFYGLSLSTKIQALLYFLIPLFTWCILFDKKEKTKLYLAAFLFFIIVPAVFFLFYPYSIDFKVFLASSIKVTKIGIGYLKAAFTLQFYKTIPWWFSYKNLAWYNGPIVLIVGTIAIFFNLFSIYRKKQGLFTLPFLLFAVFYFVYMGSCHTKFIRYMILLVPAFILFTSWFIEKAMSFKKFKKLNYMLVALVILSTVVWCAAFMSVYFHEDTRIEAGKWIYANLPEGSRLSIETGDIHLPGSCSNCGYRKFEYSVLNNSAADSINKASYLAGKLSKADYIILSSRRNYQNIMRLPEFYPLTSEYYKKLFAGTLGFMLIKEFKSYPKIFNFEVNDDTAEETFQVFDHPVVKIFKNVRRFSEDRIKVLLLKR